jgi:hypothetical protein
LTHGLSDENKVPRFAVYLNSQDIDIHFSFNNRNLEYQPMRSSLLDYEESKKLCAQFYSENIQDGQVQDEPFNEE